VFGSHVDRAHAVEPARTFYAAYYTDILHLLEEQGIPYTYVSCNFLAGWHRSTLAQPGATAPSRDKVVILGDGNAKGKKQFVEICILTAQDFAVQFL